MRTRIAGGLFPAALRAPGRLMSLERKKPPEHKPGRLERLGQTTYFKAS